MRLPIGFRPASLDGDDAVFIGRLAYRLGSVVLCRRDHLHRDWFRGYRPGATRRTAGGGAAAQVSGPPQRVARKNWSADAISTARPQIRAAMISLRALMGGSQRTTRTVRRARQCRDPAIGAGRPPAVPDCRLPT